MGTIKLGAKYAVDEYLYINSSQRVVILTDRKSSRYAKAIQKAAENRTEDVNIFVMEDYCTGKRRKFPREIMSLFDDLEQKVVSFYLAASKYQDKYELLAMDDPVAELQDKGELKHVKHVSMWGIDRKVMQQGLCVPHKLIRDYGELIYPRLKGVKKIEIVSPGGTELELKLDPKGIMWDKEDHVEYGYWENLPLGEIFTSPIDCNGTLVVDCMIGTYENYSFGFLKRYPVTFKIKKGKVVDISCRRVTNLTKSLDGDLKMDRAARNAGEIGFGINFGLDHLIGNMLQDEKVPGVHIGIGSAEPDCGKKWRSGNHFDVLMLNPTVHVDNKLLINNGKYKFKNGRLRKTKRN